MGWGLKVFGNELVPLSSEYEMSANAGDDAKTEHE